VGDFPRIVLASFVFCGRGAGFLPDRKTVSAGKVVLDSGHRPFFGLCFVDSLYAFAIPEFSEHNANLVRPGVPSSGIRELSALYPKRIFLWNRNSIPFSEKKSLNANRVQTPPGFALQKRYPR